MKKAKKRRQFSPDLYRFDLKIPVPTEGKSRNFSNTISIKQDTMKLAEIGNTAEKSNIHPNNLPTEKSQNILRRQMERKGLSKSFLKRVAGGVLTVFLSLKAGAISSGEIFWEIAGSDGTVSGWMIGLSHGKCVDEGSFPPEIKHILETAKTSLIEIKPGDITMEVKKNSVRKLNMLPPDETLSLYTGETAARDAFNFIHSALTKYDTNNVFRDVIGPQWFGIDFTSYDDFNRLTPLAVRQIIRILFNPGELDLLIKDSDPALTEKPAHPHAREEKCPPNGKVMDVYLEQMFSCAGKPVHSLESREEQLTALSSAYNYYIEAERLLDFIEDRRPKNSETEKLSQEELLYKRVSNFFQKMEKMSENHILEIYHENSEVESVKSALTEYIVRTLRGNSCFKLPKPLIGRYVDTIFHFNYFAVEQLSSGEQMDKVTKQELIRSMESANALKRRIIISCFPTINLPDDLRETEEKQIQGYLYDLNRSINGLFLSRDKKIAQRALPFLKDEEGGVVLAVGFIHLNGVIKGLRDGGLTARPLKVSRRFVQGACAKMD